MDKLVLTMTTLNVDAIHSDEMFLFRRQYENYHDMWLYEGIRSNECVTQIVKI